MDIYDMNITKEDYEKDDSLESIKNMTDEEYTRMVFVYSCGKGSKEWKERVKTFMKDDWFSSGKCAPKYRNLSADVWNLNMMA